MCSQNNLRVLSNWGFCFRYQTCVSSTSLLQREKSFLFIVCVKKNVQPEIIEGYFCFTLRVCMVPKNFNRFGLCSIEITQRCLYPKSILERRCDKCHIEIKEPGGKINSLWDGGGTIKAVSDSDLKGIHCGSQGRRRPSLCVVQLDQLSPLADIGIDGTVKWNLPHYWTCGARTACCST